MRIDIEDVSLYVMLGALAVGLTFPPAVIIQKHGAVDGGLLVLTVPAMMVGLVALLGVIGWVFVHLLAAASTMKAYAQERVGDGR